MPPKRKLAPLKPTDEDDDTLTTPTKRRERVATTIANKITAENHPNAIPIPDTTLETAVRPLFVGNPSESPSPWKQGYQDGLIYRQLHTLPTWTDDPTVLPKVASFDMDGTLITPKSGFDFPSDENDWVWLYKSVGPRLRQLYQEGWDIVIFTNQLHCSQPGSKLPKQLQLKIDMMMDILKIPISVYISTKKDGFRKPSRTMFDIMLDHYYDLYTTKFPNTPITSLLHPDSFYCGDACGRDGLTAGQLKKKPGSGPLKDHSSVDYGFAQNCFGYVVPTNPQDQLKPGQRFYVPEVLFERQQPINNFRNLKDCTIPYDFITPEGLQFDIKDSPLFQYLMKNNNYNQSQIIMCVGVCAVGKTTFSHALMSALDTDTTLSPRFEQKFCWVNQDTLKTAPKCIAAVQAGLNSKQIVIVDNTNVTTDKRNEYIAMAKKAGVPIHCVFFDVPKSLSFHLNMVRVNNTLGERERLSSIPIHKLAKDMVKPEPKEGYTTITILPYIPKSKQWSATNPRPMVPWNLSQPSPHTTIPTDKRSDEYLSQFGRVSQSRQVEDYFYQIYEN